MARLLDDIRALGRLEKPWFIPPSREDVWIEHSRRLWPMLSDHSLPVVLIDNVAEYYFTASGQEDWAIDKDFPNLAPPFPTFWLEHRMPRVIHSDKLGDSDVTKVLPQGGRVGVLAHAIDPEDCVAEGRFPETVRWILWFELFMDYHLPGGAPEGPHGMIFLCVDAEGRPLEVPWMQSFSSSEYAEVMRTFITFLHPVFLAISFLHCRNVELVDNQVDKPLARKWHEKTGNWPTPYKTLIIEPLKKILRHEGGSEQHGIQRAMHICRGHFKDYREGRGLFGKYHQLVWQPALIRSTTHKGTPPPREIEVRIKP